MSPVEKSGFSSSKSSSSSSISSKLTEPNQNTSNAEPLCMDEEHSSKPLITNYEGPQVENLEKLPDEPSSHLWSNCIRLKYFAPVLTNQNQQQNHQKQTQLRCEIVQIKTRIKFRYEQQKIKHFHSYLSFLFDFICQQRVAQTDPQRSQFRH